MVEMTFSKKEVDQQKVTKLFGKLKISGREEQKNITIPILTPQVKEDVPGSLAEPVYTAKTQDDIQGNIIPGFNKDHQHFLFYKIGTAKRCKPFLRWIVPYLSSMEEVLAFRKIFRAVRFRVGEEMMMLSATWINMAFSHNAIRKLTKAADADAFGDESFRQGLAKRSSFLGDPTAARNPGNPGKWKVGGPKNEADVIVIIASDRPSMLADAVKLVQKNAEAAGMSLVFQQRGDTLPDPYRGHEHFGFKDGVSQPGVRGKLSTEPGDYITARYIAGTDPRRLYFAKPGQLLVWPGQFLLGEPRQDANDLLKPALPATNFPPWAKLGSYLVVRRLRQDVTAFWSFIGKLAATAAMPVEKVAAMLVGRWPSGAPIVRVPGNDDPKLGEDTFANNHFLFDDSAKPSQLRPISGYPGDKHPPAVADFLATVCPHFAHIRKMNPRDSPTDLGKPEDNLTRLILRRGIPFGPSVIGVKHPSKALLAKERGLMFLSYGASIEDQFEFLQRRWSNSAVQPNLGGHDPIIGQNGTGTRERFIQFPAPGGPVNITLKDEWVTPTGGGYFFAPAISAIRDVLGA